MTTLPDPTPSTTTTDVDVLIVGAGVSGVGCAYHLQQHHPERTYAILEARGAMGGTWDLFRYPGIRSDSDLHTFGYAFKPWVNDKAIADGPAILSYIEETAGENGIDQHVRYHHKVRRASFSTPDARWTVEVERTDTGETLELTANWLFCAGGYYSYDAGYTPEFEGREDFQGQVVHPQFWPEDLDYEGKRVVIIGSGATAVTLLPAMTDKAAHVTMLQRTPTYVMPVPEKDPVANWLKKVLPAERAYAITRAKNIWFQRFQYNLSQRHPRFMKGVIRRVQRRWFDDAYIDEHFSPPYNPWDQRLCAVPNADLFNVLRKGKGSVVTDHIERFTPTGIKLKSGRELEADIIITATGLSLLALGGIDLEVDGEAVDLSQQLVYKSMMLSDVPNYAFAVGYTNSSWTLKVDLVCEHMNRLMTYMDERGWDVVVPRNDDPTIETRPLLDFGAGYVLRAVDRFPRQGSKGPWTVLMSYKADKQRLIDGPVQDAALRFSARSTVSEPELAATA